MISLFNRNFQRISVFIVLGIISTSCQNDSQKGVVTGNVVNLRESPDINGIVIGKLFKGNQIIILEKTSTENKHFKTWYKIRSNNIEGYVFHKYVAVKKKKNLMMKILPSSQTLITIVIILVVFDLIFAVINIVSGFQQNSYGQIFAGALCGLIALSSAPAVSEPTIWTVIFSVLGIILGVGAKIVAASQDILD